MTRLVTERLALTPVAEADAAFLVELMNEPGWTRNIGDRGVRSEPDARAYVRERFSGSPWFVARDRTGEPVGICGLVPRREGLEAPDLGYAVLQRHAGQGYATEAAGAVLTHLKQSEGLAEVMAIVRPENRASRRVLEKIGFRLLGERELPGLGRNACYLA